MQCQYEKSNRQCQHHSVSNQQFCKKHIRSKKEEVVTTTAMGLAAGALFANPIGLVIGASIGAYLGYQKNKHQNK